MADSYSNLYSPQISNEALQKEKEYFQRPDFKKAFPSTDLDILMNGDAASIIIAGKRYSGKSFWGQKIIDKKADQVEHIVTVSSNKFHIKTGMENKLSQYSQYDKSIIDNIIKIREGLDSKKLRPILVILDDVFVSQGQCEGIYNLLKKKDILKITIIITCQYVSLLPSIIDKINYVLLLKNDDFEEIYSVLLGLSLPESRKTIWNCPIKQIFRQLTDNHSAMVLNVTSKRIALLE